MKFEQALKGVERLFIDSAPAIYAVQIESPFSPICLGLFRFCVENSIELVTGPVTLAECTALRTDAEELRSLVGFLTASEVTFEPLGDATSILAGNLRRETPLQLADAMQVAQAQIEECQAILSNDRQLLSAQSAVRVILLSDFLDKEA